MVIHLNSRIKRNEAQRKSDQKRRPSSNNTIDQESPNKKIFNPVCSTVLSDEDLVEITDFLQKYYVDKPQNTPFN